MELTPEQLAEYELRATMAERERIAKLVDDFHWTLPMFTKDADPNVASDDAAESVKEQIVATIRSGGSPLNPL